MTRAGDQLDTLVPVFEAIRSGDACTRPDLGRLLGLGRTVVTQRVTQLRDAGLVEEGALGPSTGGRPSRELRFRADAGHLLVAEVGATRVSAAVTDLAGTLLDHREVAGDITRGPEFGLDRVTSLFTAALADRPAGAPPVWGIGVGIPGPVEFATGRPVAPPIMPGWDGHPIRDHLAAAFDAPVWVDNEVNLMALGELRAGAARGERDMIFLKVGTGIGAGLVSGGRLHRGAQGCAGDVGHIAVVDDEAVVCRCGNVGCLEALAGGAALARDALAAATSGRSPFLARLLESRLLEVQRPASGTTEGRLDARDVAAGAQHGDPVCVELLTRSGRLVGRMLATLVNFYNPSLVAVGGGVARSGDMLLAAVRQVVYGRSLPLATRSLRIVASPMGSRASLVGAASMVVDELFSRPLLAEWMDRGSPVGWPELAAAGGA